MSMHPIDELFNKRFKNLEEPTPEHLWAGIESRLHDKEPQRFLLPFWLKWSALVFIVTLVGVGGYLLVHHQTSDSRGNDSSESLVGSGFVASNEDQNMGGKSYKNSTTDVSTGVEERSGVLQKDVQGEASSKSVNVQGQEGSNSLMFHPTPMTKAVSYEKQRTSMSTSDQEEVLPPNKRVEDTDREDSVGSLFQREGVDHGNKRTEGGLTLETNRMNYDEVQSLMSVSGNINGLDFDGTGKDRNIQEYVDLGLSYGKNRWVPHFFATLLYSYDFIDRHLVAKSSGARALLTYRDTHEGLNNAFTVGLEMGCRWHAWSVMSGIHYAQVNDVFTYTIENVEGGSSGQFGDLSRRIINRYRSIEIPLLIQYDYHLGQVLLGATLGVNVGLNYEMTGALMDNQSLDIREMHSGDGTPYVSSLGILPMAGISLGYKLRPNTQIFLRPMFKYNGNSLTKEGYELEHKQTTYNLFVGMKFYIK